MKINKINYYACILLLFIASVASAQIHIPTLPSIPGPQPPDPMNNYRSLPFNNVQTEPYSNEPADIQRRNQAIIREAEEQQHLYAEIQRQSGILMLTKSGFPSQSDQPGTSCYYTAYDEIERMLKGEVPLNLGRAVFLTENAFYENSMNYDDFTQAIKEEAALCQTKIKQEKLDEQNNVVKNMMLFSLLTDTLKIRNKQGVYTSLPLKYDLDDYKSEKNYDSHFVTKLMRTHTGQCHSMPLYFLILAEEMGSEAYWSFSPMHSFVKIKDENGAWYNLEITCGAVLTDAHYMNSGLIKAEALQNRLYLEPLDKTNSVAEMLVDLAGGYYQKYGLDDFYLKCLETASHYLSNDINALKYKAAYQTRLTLTLAYLLRAKNPEEMKEKSPEAYKQYERMLALYKQIDDVGYEELPDNVYSQWLEHVENLKVKEMTEQERIKKENMKFYYKIKDD